MTRDTSQHRHALSAPDNVYMMGSAHLVQNPTGHDIGNQPPAAVTNANGDGTLTRSTARRPLLMAVGAGIAGSGVVGAGAPPSDRDAGSSEGAVIAPPLRGEWLAVNPPGHFALATDFIGMRAGHRLPYSASSIPRHLLTRMPVDRAYGWERPVYAPVDGRVVAVSSREPDRDRVNLVGDAVNTFLAPPTVEDGDVRPAAGNYVLIESDEGLAFLAHLRQGSVVVSAGTQVTVGQSLGTVGNSGASLFPHLHFQLMHEWTTDGARLDEVLRPYRFASYERWTGNWLSGYEWKPVQDRVPGHRERFRVPGSCV